MPVSSLAFERAWDGGAARGANVRTRLAAALVRAAVLGVSLMAAAGEGPALAQQPVPSIGWAADAATLREAASTPAARMIAARRLMASGDAGARQFVLETLRSPDTAAESRDALLAAFNQVIGGVGTGGASAAGGGGPTSQLPLATIEWIAPGIVAGVELASAERRADWVACLCAIRTRESLRTILRYMDSAQPQGVREAAFTAAARLSGQYQLGSDAKKWADWFGGVEWIPEPEWQRTLAEGLTQYTLYLETQRDVVVRRLIESERRRLIEAPTEQDRWNILAAQLKDELQAMRRLGVELTNRELANAKLPAGPVPLAALGLLSDPSPDLRIAGANLVERLQPANAAPIIAQTLLNEKDPAVLKPMLRLAARWPSPEIRAKLLDWLTTGTVTTPPPTTPPSGTGSSLQADAIRTLDAIEKVGMLNAPEDRERVLSAVRGVDLNAAGTSTLRLRAVLGDAQDRALVSTLLSHADPARRLAAAQALSGFNDWLDPIVAAAREDEALLPVAAAMIARCLPNLEGLHLLLSLPLASATPGAGAGTASSTTTARDPVRDTILSLAEKLTPADVLAVAPAIEDTELREAVLARFITLPLGPLSVSFVRRDDVQSLITATGLLRLAQTRLELHKPAAALAAIDRIEEAGVPVSRELLASLKAQGLLGVNRIADAIELDAPPSAWIIALAEIVELPHAPAVLRVLEANFSGSLSQPELEALGGLRVLVSQRHPNGATTADESRQGGKKNGPRLPGR